MSIDRDEFLYHMTRVQGRFDKVDEKQDQLLERVHANETEFALLQQTVRGRRRNRQVWRAILGALAAIAGAIVHAFIGSAAAGAAKP